MFLIVALTPVQEWVTAAVLAFGALTAVTCAIAHRQTDHDKAVGFWLAPVVPALACGYLLIGPFLLAIGANISA